MITLLTHHAAQDDLTDADYHDIYDELREGHTLRQFCQIIGEPASRIAWWSKYERHEASLTRPARNALRAAIGLAPLPPAVGDLVDAIDPDAAVWRIGPDHPAHRVLLISQAGPLTLHINGADPTIVTSSTPGTSDGDHPSNPPDPSNPLKPKPRYWRPALPLYLRQQLADRGIDLVQIIQAALDKE